jgi:hypothetical protein
MYDTLNAAYQATSTKSNYSGLTCISRRRSRCSRSSTTIHAGMFTSFPSIQEQQQAARRVLQAMQIGSDSQH